MSNFEEQLAHELDEIRGQGLYRQCVRIESAQGARVLVNGREYVNFSSNDYLGLANDPRLKQAAAAALQKFGAGSGASRLICGSLAPHHELEEALAEFKRTEAALSFSSGYATALGTIGALVGHGDVIVLDRLVHACIVDAARLSGAKLRVFAHNDLDALEKILRWARESVISSHEASQTRPRRVLIATESIFSMDGDGAPLAEIVGLKEKYGAWLMVDEAHGTGVVGASGRGLLDAHGLTGRVEVQMGTLGKALGAAGGYIAGPRVLVDLLVNRARSFIFSTAPPPAAAAAARAGIELAQSAEGDALRQGLHETVRRVQAVLAESSIAATSSESRTGAGPALNKPAAAILPYLVGAEEDAVRLASRLRERDLFVPAIRYPTVGRGKARLRFTVTAGHSAAEVDALATALRTL